MSGDPAVLALASTAFVLGLVHTLLGPDHYLPFVVLKAARGWSYRRTAAVVAACGLGHVLSSFAIGLGGIWIGYQLGVLQSLEQARGDWAGRALFAFGILYTVYGLWAALRNRPHVHRHVHQDGTVHEHVHGHAGTHAHPHGDPGRVTPWVLFVIFVLGPCEPLIPLLIAPAAKIGFGGVALVTAAFAVATVSTMLIATLLLSRGVSLLPLRALDRFMHTLAGGAIASVGAGMLFLGW